MESFVRVSAWQPFATALNLLTFFLSFSAFCVGAFVASRLARHRSPAWLRGVAHAFLAAALALAIRTLAIAAFLLGWIPDLLAVAVADVAMLGVGAALFWVYVILDRYLARKEAA